MDVGKFKAGRARLVAWIIIPPIAMVSVGLSTYALKQHTEWKLKQSQAISDILPDIIQARKQVQNLFESKGLTRDQRITTSDQLFSLLEEKARNRNVTINRKQILNRENVIKTSIPMLNALVEASGTFSSYQLFLNDVLAAYPLISLRSVDILQSSEGNNAAGFQLRVMFDLMLVDEVLKADGGAL